MNDAVDQEHTAEKVGEHEEIERFWRAQIEESEQVSARHRLDAVLAAGERRLQREKVDHLREGERDHGEIDALAADRQRADDQAQRSEEHTSELQSLMRISYAVFCLKKKREKIKRN